MPLPFSLVVKKGSKMRASGLSRHPRTRVCHREPNVSPRFHGDVRVGILLIELDIAGFDGELPSARHRVAGIHGQVHDDLLELSRIRQDVSELARQMHCEVDVFTEQAAEHALDPPDDLVHVRDPGLDDLLAAEAQELSGQGCRSLARLVHLPDVIAKGVRLLEPLDGKGAVRQDDAEQVVEVVCDASRKAADGLESLRGDHLVFRARMSHSSS